MKKIIVLILTVLMSISSLCAFGCLEKVDDQTINATNNSDVMLADFEQWGPDFQLIRLFNNFGKVTRNKDANYVKNGKYSAKFQTVGGYIDSSNPLIYFTAISDLFEFDYRDFTEYSEISCYVYNATSKRKEVTVGLVTGVASATAINIAQGQIFVLEPNQWTRIDYWLDANFLSLFLDLKKIEGVYFQFENTGNLYVDEENVYYLDDLKLCKAETKQEIIDIIEVDDGEVCYFEKAYQNYIVTAEIPTSESSAISLSTVNVADYQLPVSFGTKALKCTVHSTLDASQSASKIVFTEKLLSKSSLKITDANAEDMTFLKTTYFAFDIYITDDTSGYKNEFSVWYTTKGYGGNGSYVWPLATKDMNYGYVNGRQVIFERGTFDKYAPNTKPQKDIITTYKISLYELAFGRAAGNGIDFLKNPGKIAIWVNANTTGRDITYFFDNFRIEKGEEVFVKEVEE